MTAATDKQMPVMDLKDHKANKHDLFVRYFGELRAWIALAMQQAIAQLKEAPSSLGFDWMFVDLPKMVHVPSYPKEKTLPRKLTAPHDAALILARTKKRKTVRTYNVTIARLRQAGQDQLWACLKRSFGDVHSSWFDEHDPFILVEKATREAHAMPLDDARQHIAIARDAGTNHGSRLFLRLKAHYLNVQPTGILSRMIDAEDAENSFTGDWEAYRNKMTSVWHQLRSSVENYSPEQLQVLKCLTALINNPHGRLESWRQWSQNYLMNHGAQPAAWTLEGFLALGTEHANSQAVTTRSARSAGAHRAHASYANAGGQMQQQRRHGGRKGNYKGRVRPGGAPAPGQTKPCSNCGAKFKPTLPQHNLCDGCHRGGALHNYVGSADGASRLKGRIDKKRKAGFAKAKRDTKRAKANLAQAHQPAADQATGANGQVVAAMPPPSSAGVNLAHAAAHAGAARQVPAGSARQTLMPPGILRDGRVGFDLRHTLTEPADIRMVYAGAPPAHARVVTVRPALASIATHAVCNYAQVGMAMDAQPFSIPDDLRHQLPEDFAVLDSGAMYHTVGTEGLILDPTSTNMVLTWGNGDTSRAMAQGRLICSTIILQTAHLGTSAVCGNYLFKSQTCGDALYSPDVTRNLVSVPRLINDSSPPSPFSFSRHPPQAAMFSSFFLPSEPSALPAALPWRHRCHPPPPPPHRSRYDCRPLKHPGAAADAALSSPRCASGRYLAAGQGLPERTYEKARGGDRGRLRRPKKGREETWNAGAWLSGRRHPGRSLASPLSSPPCSSRPPSALSQLLPEPTEWHRHCRFRCRLP